MLFFPIHEQNILDGAFHHLNRRKATIADTGLHEFKDLQKTALTSPLSGEGIFGPEFEEKLKDRHEKDKQLSGPRQANLCLRAFRHDKF